MEERMLMATFTNRENVDRALQAVAERSGYAEEDVSVFRSIKTREKYFGADRHAHVAVKQASKVPEGITAGALIGAVLGGLAGFFGIVTLQGVLAVPPLGVAIAGPLVAVLVGLGLGSVLGGMLGAPIGALFPEERPVRRTSDFDRGGLVLSIVPHSEEDAEHLRRAWKACSGERVYYQDHGAWDLFKARLLESYDETLHDSELDRYEGQREQLIDYVQERTGQPRDAVQRHVCDAVEQGRYAFPTAIDVAANGAWKRFKNQLRRVYEGLTDEEIERHKGQREKLERHIQERTGQPRDAVKANMDGAARKAKYAF